MVCRSRFRVHAIEGLRACEGFNHRIEYGNLWHAAEEAGAGWQDAVWEYAGRLDEKYPLAREQVNHWVNVLGAQYPEYLAFWDAHPEPEARVPAEREKVFDVPYTLPSGRVVRLRGKRDGVDRVAGTGRYKMVEHKTKGDIDEVNVGRRLTFDLQLMTYFTALYHDRETLALLGGDPGKIEGAVYNVVRRPLAGGRHTIRQKQGEKPHEFYARLRECVAGDPGYFFMRWPVPVHAEDVRRFRRTCLDAVLENVCDDYEWWADCFRTHGDAANHARRHNEFPHHFPRHYRHPYGVWNMLDDGGTADVDNFLETGSQSGLVRADTLFPELEV